MSIDDATPKEWDEVNQELKKDDRVLIYKFINKLSTEINSVENN